VDTFLHYFPFFAVFVVAAVVIAAGCPCFCRATTVRIKADSEADAVPFVVTMWLTKAKHNGTSLTR